MSEKWDTIDLLRHARHDWLNRLQLIKGNIALDHIDRANMIIDEIVIQARQEAKLSNLGMPTLVEKLLTFNWHNHHYRLEFEVIGDELNLSSFEEGLTLGIKSLFSALDSSVDELFENHLLFTFQLLDEEIRLIIDFNGKITNIESIKSWVKEVENQTRTFSVISSHVQEDEFVVTLQLNDSVA
ncbi:Spo0B C-terminal domain-containing protein [Bacillus taeanensis]|nr:Spo0B C-terminal domain-containing protein [Bacillus taeanensis]